MNEETIQEFSTGAKRNTDGKEDYVETISWLAMKRYAEYMTSKQTTYGAGNWKKGIPIESYERSLTRHIQKYLANKYDGASLEPNEDHLAAIMFNVMGLLHEEEKAKQPLTEVKLMDVISDMMNLHNILAYKDQIESGRIATEDNR